MTAHDAFSLITIGVILIACAAGLIDAVRNRRDGVEIGAIVVITIFDIAIWAAIVFC